jgi:hypothetical protein
MSIGYTSILCICTRDKTVCACVYFRKRKTLDPFPQASYRYFRFAGFYWLLLVSDAELKI